VQGRVFQVKFQCSGANIDGFCGCRAPLEGVIAAILSALGLLLKIQDFVVSMTVTLHCVVSFLGALSWILSSLSLFDVFGGKLVASSNTSLFHINLV
jgi:hypothetical protein